MNYELYQKKYKYERLIKSLDEALVKLEDIYSNLILCKKTVSNSLQVDDKYYHYGDFEKIVNNIDSNIDIIKNIILPQARNEYNRILFEISKL